MTQIESLLGMTLAAMAQVTGLSKADLLQVERIGDQSVLECPARGFSLILPDHEHIGAVHLHSQGYEGYTRFGGELPVGMQFSDTRAIVRQRLGAPALSGEAKSVPVIGKVPPYDIYLVGEIKVRVQYDFDESRVLLVTLTKTAG